jgi:hypothetical protein
LLKTHKSSDNAAWFEEQLFSPHPELMIQLYYRPARQPRGNDDSAERGAPC